MSVEPRYLSADMDNPPMPPQGQGVYGIARLERVMSRNPHQPRAFSLAHIMIPAWLPLGALMTWAGVSMLLDNTDGFREGYAGWIIILGSLAAPYTGLTQGVWLRPGVDHDKIWTRFGPFFYRQIRFNDITRIGIGIERYKIWAGKTKINIDYHRYPTATSNSPKPTSPTPTGTKKPKYGATAWQPTPTENTTTSTTPTPNN